MGQPAARLGDLHVCPASDGPKPHGGGPITGPGAPTVLIQGLPAARLGDAATCVGPPSAVVGASATVFIGGQPAARVGDSTAHGGVITTGAPTVFIGDSATLAVSSSIPHALTTANSAPRVARAVANAALTGRAPLAPQSVALQEAAQEGIALVERCPFAHGH